MNVAYKVVDRFEKEVADYCGAKYGVAVSSCTNAIFLALQYVLPEEVTIPKITYPGVAQAILQCGANLKFNKYRWKNQYILDGSGIWDSAIYFHKGCYRQDFTCLSFHAKKHIPIGRGGMILTNSANARDVLKRMRFDGRYGGSLKDDKIYHTGWNMYMTPDQAARGLMLLDVFKAREFHEIDDYETYPDLSKHPYFKKRSEIVK